MARGRRRKELDGRPLHGYGVLLESDEGRIANSDVATWGLSLGPLITAGGVSFLVDDRTASSEYWYCGWLLLALGVAATGWGVFLTVRGFHRWRHNRAAERAAVAAAAGKPVPLIKIQGRRRY